MIQTRAWVVLYKPELFSDDASLLSDLLSIDSLAQCDYQLYQIALGTLDGESQGRIKRFYRREDSCRTLIGKLLVRVMLSKNGVDPRKAVFCTTPEGKPYIILPEMYPAFVHNITHDNGLVGLVFASGDLGQRWLPKVGVDVMLVRIPRGEALGVFVETMSDQLTAMERELVEGASEEQESLERFFWMWTLKEAYTKALGLGLGFDFQRVEFLVDQGRVRVDNQELVGWRFDLVVIQDGQDRYQLVVATDTGGGGGTSEVVVHHQDEKPSWLCLFEAAEFTREAVTFYTSAIDCADSQSS